MKYKLHIPYVNRQDKLRNAVASVRAAFPDIHVWADGSAQPDIDGVTHHALPPMPFTAVMNVLIQSSFDDDVLFFMHNDAVALQDSAQKFLDFVRAQHASEVRWGVVFSSYDAFCAFNMKAVRSVGFWDTQFNQYMSDNDFYYRLRTSGWKLIDSAISTADENGCGILHRRGSQTLESDRLYKLVTAHRGQRDLDYYKAKWGGEVSQERFGCYPFGGSYLLALCEPTPLLTSLQADVRDEGNLLDEPSDTRAAQLHTMFEYISRRQPRRVLETGTNKGYFGYLLSLLLADFRLTTCDGDNRSARAAGLLGDRVTFILGDTQTILPKLDGPFDLAWIDGGHSYGPAFSDISNAIRLQIPCIMIDDTNVPSVREAIDHADLARDYHIIEPFTYMHDQRRMVVAMRKG